MMANCELPNTPEQCLTGTPLTWDRNNAAVKTYKVPGTMSGSNTFDLNTWVDGNGGTWENWYVSNGTFNELAGNAPTCVPTQLKNNFINQVRIFPNPASNIVNISSNEVINCIEIYTYEGKLMCTKQLAGHYKTELDVSYFTQGIYIIKMMTENGRTNYSKIIKQ